MNVCLRSCAAALSHTGLSVDKCPQSYHHCRQQCCHCCWFNQSPSMRPHLWKLCVPCWSLSVAQEARLLLINMSTAMTGLSMENVPPCLATSKHVRHSPLSIQPLYMAIFESQAVSGPPSRISKSTTAHMCVRALYNSFQLINLFCAHVGLAIFRTATYQFNMLHSPHHSSPRSTTSFHSRWLRHGARRHSAPCLLSDIFLPPCARSSRTFIKQRQRNAQTKTTSLNAENRSYSFERSGSTHHIYLEEANWFNLPCLHHA